MLLLQPVDLVGAVATADRLVVMPAVMQGLRPSEEDQECSLQKSVRGAKYVSSEYGTSANMSIAKNKLSIFIASRLTVQNTEAAAESRNGLEPAIRLPDEAAKVK